MGEWDEQKVGARTNGSGLRHDEDDEPQAQMEAMMENARREVETYVETAADFIRERPVACVAAAIGLGFLIGKIASRR